MSHSDPDNDTPRVQYRPLVARPELHQDWQDEQEERNVTWPELFFDLFFVAAITNLGHLFKETPDAPNAGRIVLYHAIMFFVWADYATLKTRYRLRGLLYRCIGLTLQLGTLGFIIGVRNDAQWHHLLAGGYALARAATSTAYAIIAATISRARPLSLVHISLSSLLVVSAACASIFRESYNTFHWLFIGIALVEAAIPLVPSVALRQYDLPLHVEHMSERLGQLVMLHLGEAVIGFASSPLESTVPQFVAVALAAVLVWCLHLCYYHIEPDQHDHAYRQSRARGLLFFYCHWPLAVSFLLTGTGLRLMLGLYPGAEDTAALHTTLTAPIPHQTPLVPSQSPPSAAAAAAAAAAQPTTVTMSKYLSPGHSWSLLFWPSDQQHLEPVAQFEVALLLCVSYAASLHLLALIRAAHYFSLDPQHRIVRSQERKGVKCWWNAWWAMLWLWPLPVYFIPVGMKVAAAAAAAAAATTAAAAAAAGSGSADIAQVVSLLQPVDNKELQLGLAVHRSLRRPAYLEHYPQAIGMTSSTAGFEGFMGYGGIAAYNNLSATALLALLACHAVILTLSESLFAHKIARMPIAAGLADTDDDQEDSVNEAPSGQFTE